LLQEAVEDIACLIILVSFTLLVNEAKPCLDITTRILLNAIVEDTYAILGKTSLG
jgi:hypothetical protein